MINDEGKYWTDRKPNAGGFYWVADKNKNILGVSLLKPKTINEMTFYCLNNEEFEREAVYYFRQKQNAPVFKDITRTEVITFIRTMMRDTDNYKSGSLWKTLSMIKNVRTLTGWGLMRSRDIVNETLWMSAIDIFRFRKKSLNLISLIK